MDERHYKILRNIAIVLALFWVGWTIYDGMLETPQLPGETAFSAGNRAFEDGLFIDAINYYEEALNEVPDNLPSQRGIARSLMQLGRLDEALATFNKVIAKEPEFAASYANRGILKDRLGRYQEALTDYERALSLEPELAEGPGFLTRFLRNQSEKPPTIADRARYLKEQLAKPESERILRVIEEDEKQRSYKYEPEEK
jgi:tetratricopeptide (TPR) repeat protein